MNLAIDEMVRFSDRVHQLPTTGSLLYLAYQHTAPGSPLRAQVRDWHPFEGGNAQFDDSMEEFPKELLFDIAKQYQKTQKGLSRQASPRGLPQGSV